MILIILLATLIIIISYPIIGYKIYKSFRKNHKQKLYKLTTVLVILILVPGFFWKILPGSEFFWRPIEKVQERNYNKELTGFKFSDGEKIYEYETERAFNGDGYSIWIYKIDDSTANYFTNPNSEFFAEYPKTELRNHWKSEHWKKTPFNKNDQKFLDFAHTELSQLNFELEDLLNEEGNYYAYEYYMHDISDENYFIGNIDFYIICPRRKIMVKVNHNT